MLPNVTDMMKIIKRKMVTAIVVVAIPCKSSGNGHMI